MARLTVVLAFAVHASTHAIPVDFHSRLRNMADSMAEATAESVPKDSSRSGPQHVSAGAKLKITVTLEDYEQADLRAEIEALTTEVTTLQASEEALTAEVTRLTASLRQPWGRPRSRDSRRVSRRGRPRSRDSAGCLYCATPCEKLGT